MHHFNGAGSLKGGAPVLYRDETGLRRACPHAGFLVGMGCIASFSAPVRDGGAVLDGVSIPERSGAQDEGQRAAFNRLAPCLVPTFRAEAAGHARAFIA